MLPGSLLPPFLRRETGDEANVLHWRTNIVFFHGSSGLLVRASSMCTDITLSAPVLYITSTLDTIESLSDTAQGLGYPQVPRGREVVQLLKYFGSMCFRKYELF